MRIKSLSIFFLHFQNYLLKRFMQDCVGPEQIVTIPDQSQCPDCNSLPLNGYEAFPTCETEEKRFLAFIEHCKRQREEKKRLDETMTPSGNFVVLEAKEMLKHFTPEGLAVNESDTLRQLATSKVGSQNSRRFFPIYIRRGNFP
jgi:hypothetical protein